MKKLGMMIALMLAGLAAQPVAHADYRMDVCVLGNIWDGTASTGVGGVDAVSMLIESQSHMTILGNSSGATVIHVLASMDDVIYYDTGRTIVVTGAGDFASTFEFQTVFIAFKSDNDVTITASICGYGG